MSAHCSLASLRPPSPLFRPMAMPEHMREVSRGTVCRRPPYVRRMCAQPGARPQESGPRCASSPSSGAGGDSDGEDDAQAPWQRRRCEGAPLGGAVRVRRRTARVRRSGAALGRGAREGVGVATPLFRSVARATSPAGHIDPARRRPADARSNVAFAYVGDSDRRSSPESLQIDPGSTLDGPRADPASTPGRPRGRRSTPAI